MWQISTNGLRPALATAFVALTSSAALAVLPLATAQALPREPRAGLATTATSTSTSSASASATSTSSPTPSSSPSETPIPSPSSTQSPDAVGTATPEPVTPSTAPNPMPTALGSWCTALFPPQKPSVERRQAQSIMNGVVLMGKYGQYVLGERPNWRPQSGTDTSGDRHINSLDWTLPLLYRGVRVQNPAMVDRFRQLLTWWIEDHRGPRSTWVDASIYGGLRTQTLVCAAQTLGDPIIAQAAIEEATKMVKSNAGDRGVAVGTNNTDLIRQTGALAAFCWTGNWPLRDKAWANIVAVTRGLIHDDGSDVEGSPGYAEYVELLLKDVESAAATCGMAADPIPELRGRIYDFLAQAIRPDFQLESLGDTINEPLRSTFGAGDSRADWVRSRGTQGTPPTPIFTSYQGGYVFGRAGWQPQPGGADTYYTLRYKSTRPGTAHTHDDGASMTMMSRGVEWIIDPGPFKYENGSKLRWFMKTRAAHSSFTVGKVKRNKSASVRSIKAISDWPLGGNDLTCIEDTTWSTVTVTRCTTFIRSVDAIVVVDYVNAAKGKGKKGRKRFFWERWQLAPGISGSNAGDVMTLSSGDKRLDIYKSGPGNWAVDIARNGSNIGWSTGAWGEKLPGAVLNRQAPIGKPAMSMALVTVFVPRVDGESVPVVIDERGVTITRGGLTITTPLPQ